MSAEIISGKEIAQTIRAELKDRVAELKEGGLTPGRVAEALAAAGTASLDNAVLHLDWNQASIDSNHVCRDGGRQCTAQ